MNKKTEDDINLTHDNAIGRLKEIKDDRKTIGARSSWLLGLMVIIALAFGGFSFKDFETGQPLMDKFISTLKTVSLILFIIYSATVAIYVRLLIVPSLGEFIHNDPEEQLTKEQEIPKLQNKIKVNKAILDELNRHLNSLIVLFTLPLFSTPFLIVFLFLFYLLF